MIDCIYVAASTLDARFTRICVASLRKFYPEIPIKLLVGGPLQKGLEEELKRYWNVTIADVPRGDYGWGFVKLEPLFAPPGERFLMLDSDTVITGPVLEGWRDSTAPFLVDNEEYSEAGIRSRYYDWKKILEVDQDAQPSAFVFNSGQWIGTSGILTREDFAPFVEWKFPRKLRHQEYFFPGDQGVLNYVLNKKHLREKLRVDRLPIMHWPGYGMPEFDAKSVAGGKAASRVVHWAGVKKVRHTNMIGADLLSYFELLYYERIPLAFLRRRWAVFRDVMAHYRHGLLLRFRLAFRKYIGVPLTRVWNTG
jgi:hypothetical protein